MQCPKCGYLMSSFDADCPRCKNLETSQPSQSQPVSPATTSPQQTAINPADNSGLGSASVLPAELSGSTSEVLFFKWLWCRAHNVRWAWWMVTCPRKFRVQANELAWQNRKWKSVQEFKDVQKVWDWGSYATMWVILLIFSTVLYLGVRSVEDSYSSSNQSQSTQPYSQAPSSTPAPTSTDNRNVNRLTPDEQNYVVTLIGWIKFMNPDESTDLTPSQNSSIIFARVDQVWSERMDATSVTVPSSFESVDSLFTDFLMRMKDAKVSRDLDDNDGYKRKSDQAFSELNTMSKEVGTTMDHINQDQTRQQSPVSSEYEALMNSMSKK